MVGVREGGYTKVERIEGRRDRGRGSEKIMYLNLASPGIKISTWREYIWEGG